MIQEQRPTDPNLKPTCNECRKPREINYTLGCKGHSTFRFCSTTCLFAFAVSELLAEGASTSEILAAIRELLRNLKEIEH